MPKSDAEVIVVPPRQKSPMGNRAWRRKNEALTHRMQFCRHRCEICNDYVPAYYCDHRPARRWRRELKRNRITVPLNRLVTVCYDCLNTSLMEHRQQHQRWCAEHRFHPVERLIRLARFRHIDIDPARLWQQWRIAESQEREPDVAREIEECIAGLIHHQAEEYQTHPFADAMGEMAARELLPPLPMQDDEATESTAGIEVEVFRLSGEAGITLSDAGWRQLHHAVTHCISTYQGATANHR